MEVFSLIPLMFYPWEKSPGRLSRRMRVPQHHPGHCGEDKNLYPLSGFKLQTIQPVA